MRLQEFAALALAASVFAHPTIHHIHKHHRLSLRSLRDVLSKRTEYTNVDLSGADFSNVDLSGADFSNVDTSGVDWSKVKYPGEDGEKSEDAPITEDKHAVVTSDSGSESKSEAKAESKSDSKSESKSDSKSDSKDEPKKKTSSGGKCVDLAKRATVQQDNYVGNTDGNIKGASNCEPSGDEKYSITFVNNFDEEKEFIAWNKIGKSGKMDGMMTEPDKKFKLGPGEKGTLVYGPNSQVGFGVNCPRASSFGGVPGCNVAEANFNDQNSAGGAVGGSFYDVSMVTYNDIKNGGGSPTLIPMKLSADGYDDSTDQNCVYTHSSQNSPVQPGSSGKCACGPNDASPFHITATFG